MLTPHDNDRLTRVGPGTPMGELMREVWHPAVRSESIVANGAPRPIRILGEDLVAFRNADGSAGFMQRACPHRRASLALARNEGDGLRCIFHGWKFNSAGKTVDVPTEPRERCEAFASRVPLKTYPAREAGGVVWIYMGHRETPPDVFDFEFHHPPASALIRCAIVNGNWLQGFEGQLDSAHLNFLHASSIPRSEKSTSTMVAADTAPVFEIIDTPYGFREAALRKMPDGSTYARIREVVLPYWSLIPGNHGDPRLVVVVTPIDDESSMHWYYYMNPFGPVPQWYIDGAMRGSGPDDDDFAADRGNAANNWHQDREAMAKGHFSGIMKNFVYEDFIIEESMGPIMDRSKEFLGSSDAVIVRTRRLLLQALDAHAKGKIPFGLDQKIDYRSIRTLAVRYPAGMDWKDIDLHNPGEFEFKLSDNAPVPTTA